MARMIKAMKLWKLPKHKQHIREVLCENGEYFGQLKKDGYWYAYEKDIEGISHLWSRVVSKNGLLSDKIDNVPHIKEWLDRTCPRDTVLIGEIYYPNGTSSDVTKIMGCKAEKAIERQEGEYGYIHYYVHDMLYYGGISYMEKTNIERYNNLYILNDLTSMFSNECVEFAEMWTNNLDERITESLNNGEEGMVLKLKAGKYIPDKKPAWNMIKFKREDSHDVICTGFESPKMLYIESNGLDWGYWESLQGKTVHIDPNEFFNSIKQEDDGTWTGVSQTGESFKAITRAYYHGWIGALKMGVYKDNELINIGTVSGLTDNLCESIKEDRYVILNKPIKVDCMMVAKEGLRHPSFGAIRDDINVSDCTWDKIFK